MVEMAPKTALKWASDYPEIKPVNTDQALAQIPDGWRIGHLINRPDASWSCQLINSKTSDWCQANGQTIVDSLLTCISYVENGIIR